jgi:riboflavin synthase
MFTGIVEEIGEVLAVREHAEVVVLTVRGRTVTSDAAHGDSIAVNGVCLTVTDPAGSTDGTFTVELVPETLKRTSLSAVAPGAGVNLERAMVAGGRLGGHIVQGHVDGVATLVRRTPGGTQRRAGVQPARRPRALRRREGLHRRGRGVTHRGGT